MADKEAKRAKDMFWQSKVEAVNAKGIVKEGIEELTSVTVVIQSNEPNANDRSDKGDKKKCATCGRICIDEKRLEQHLFFDNRKLYITKKDPTDQHE